MDEVKITARSTSPTSAEDNLSLSSNVIEELSNRGLLYNPAGCSRAKKKRVRSDLRHMTPEEKRERKKEINRQAARTSRDKKSELLERVKKERDFYKSAYIQCITKLTPRFQVSISDNGENDPKLELIETNYINKPHLYANQQTIDQSMDSKAQHQFEHFEHPAYTQVAPPQETFNPGAYNQEVFCENGKTIEQTAYDAASFGHLPPDPKYCQQPDNTQVPNQQSGFCTTALEQDSISNRAACQSESYFSEQSKQVASDGSEVFYEQQIHHSTTFEHDASNQIYHIDQSDYAPTYQQQVFAQPTDQATYNQHAYDNTSYFQDTFNPLINGQSSSIQHITNASQDYHFVQPIYEEIQPTHHEQGSRNTSVQESHSTNSIYGHVTKIQTHGTDKTGEKYNLTNNTAEALICEAYSSPDRSQDQVQVHGIPDVSSSQQVIDTGQKPVDALKMLVDLDSADEDTDEYDFEAYVEGREGEEGPGLTMNLEDNRRCSDCRSMSDQRIRERFSVDRLLDASDSSSIESSSELPEEDKKTERHYCFLVVASPISSTHNDSGNQVSNDGDETNNENDDEQADDEDTSNQEVEDVNCEAVSNRYHSASGPDLFAHTCRPMTDDDARAYKQIFIRDKQETKSEEEEIREFALMAAARPFNQDAGDDDTDYNDYHERFVKSDSERYLNSSSCSTAGRVHYIGPDSVDTNSLASFGNLSASDELSVYDDDPQLLFDTFFDDQNITREGEKSVAGEQVMKATWDKSTTLTTLSSVFIALLQILLLSVNYVSCVLQSFKELSHYRKNRANGMIMADRIGQSRMQNLVCHGANIRWLGHRIPIPRLIPAFISWNH